MIYSMGKKNLKRKASRFIKLCGGSDLPLLLQDLQKAGTNSSYGKARHVPASSETLKESRRSLLLRTQSTSSNEVIVLCMSICGTVALDFLSRGRGDLKSLARPHKVLHEIP